MAPAANDDPLAPWDTAYDHFARALGGPLAEGYDPVLLQTALVRLRGPNLAAHRAQVLAAVAGGELLLAASGGAAPAVPQDGTPFTLLWPDEDPQDVAARYGGALEVLQLGRPVGQPLSPAPAPSAAPSAAPAAAAPPSGQPAPIVAVIDDGIGFLNRRFCRPGSPASTRFHAVWLQALRTIHPPGGHPGYVQAGRVLARADIDAWLARGARLDEAEVYREINRALLEPGAHRSTEFALSHGTHVLDLAAGADPALAEPACDWPLLAVQLPPEAVDNTAGTLLEPLLVQGVHWCLREAEVINAASPLVIVVAFATYAGPKDGSKAVEALIAQAVEDWRGRTGREARVVYAYGNARLTRQGARLAATGAGTSLDWRILPEDFTASYLELRPEDPGAMARLSVTLTPPRGPAQALGPLPANASRVIRDAAGRMVGRYYHIGPRVTAPGVVSPAHGVLALAPTVEEGGRPLAPHGGWRLALAATAGPAITLRAEVQRDDTPGNYRQKGRQSYLDHPGADVWERESGGWTGLDPAGPLTRQGSHSSFVTAASPATLPAAAGRASGRAPARYSAEGAPWTRPGPALAALADRGTAALGLIASGTFSGAARRLDGSSAAAGRAARALASRYAAHGAGAPGAAEVAGLLADYGTPLPPQPARLGAGLLAGPVTEGPALAM